MQTDKRYQALRAVMLLMMTMCSMGLWAQGFTLSPTAGTDGANGDEDYDKLFDGIYWDEDILYENGDPTGDYISNKWCVTDLEGQDEEGSPVDKYPVFVEFESNVAIIPVGYILYTGNDNVIWSGRNPSTWSFMAKADKKDSWKVLHSVSGSYEMEDLNYEPYEFRFQNANEYKYFRLEINAVQDGGDNVLQLSELELIPYVNGNDISTGYIEGVQEYYTYTGSAIDLSDLTIYDANYDVIDPSDYTVTIKNSSDETVNINNITALETYTLTVTGNGDYSGEKSRSFHIVLWSGNQGGWCGVSTENNGRNLYYEVSVVNGVKILTIRKNTIESGTDYSMGDSSGFPNDVKRVIIEDGVSSIANSAFESFDRLELVEIGRDVESIGTNAFFECSKLKHVLCYADPSKLTWTESECDDFIGSATDKTTICHVMADKLSGFNTKWNTSNSDTDVNVTFSGDLEGIGKSLSPGRVEGLMLSYIYTGSAIDLGEYVVKNIYDETIPSGKYSATIIDGNSNVVASVTDPGNYTLTLGPAVGSDYTGSLSYDFQVEMSMFDQGYCGNPSVNGGRNLMFSVRVAKGKKTLTIRKNPDAVGDDFSMECYRWDDTDEYCVFAPWIDPQTSYLWDDALGADFFDCHYPFCDINHVVIEDGVTSIGDCAFSHCTSLESVRIGNDVEIIGENAFEECHDLADVQIGTSVTTIDEYAFYCCYSLGSIIIPNSVTRINDYAFDGCSGLETVVIGSGMMQIGYDTFYGCVSVKDVYCYADASGLYWFESFCDDFSDDPDAKTVCHVFDKDSFDAKWATGDTSEDVNVNFVGDMVYDLSHVPAFDLGEILRTEVKYTRSFTAGTASTICLPIDMTSISGGKVYEFVGVTYDDVDGWVATMSDATPGSNLVTSTQAHRPYLFLPDADGEVVFRGSIKYLPMVITAGTSTSGDWTFHGTYDRLDYGDEGFSGTVFGFAATSGKATDGMTDVEAGQFVKAGSGAYILPFRAFLTYSGSNTALHAPARGVTDTPAIPNRIKVRLLGAGGEVTGIGAIDMNTGEITIDQWYYLNGQPVEGTPSAPGLYLNSDGKKVMLTE